MKSTLVKASEVQERWILYDASEHNLGRMASKIAMSLMGKDRPTYTPSQLVGAHVVKGFNNIYFKHLATLARPAGATDRTALPIAGDDADAKRTVTEFLDRIGYDTVDVGPLAEKVDPSPDAERIFVELAKRMFVVDARLLPCVAVERVEDPDRELANAR